MADLNSYLLSQYNTAMGTSYTQFNRAEYEMWVAILGAQTQAINDIQLAAINSYLGTSYTDNTTAYSAWVVEAVANGISLGPDPASLFGANHYGGFWDFTDLTQLKQNSNGTGDVSINDPVGWADNQLSNGTDPLIQATASLKFVAQDGYCQSPADADRLYSTTFNNTGTAHSVVIGLRVRTSTALAHRFCGTGTGTGLFWHNNGGGSVQQFRSYLMDSAGHTATNATNVADGSWHTVLVEVLGTTSDSIGLWYDGTKDPNTSVGSNINSLSGQFYLGASTSSLDGGNPQDYKRAFIRYSKVDGESALTSDERADITGWLEAAG